MSSFGEFIDKKTRNAKKRLSLVEKILQRGGLQTKSHIDEGDDPFIFVNVPNKRVSFAGVRIYQIGETIAYRVQKEEKKAYKLDIEEMYDDLVSDEDISEKKAAYMVIEALPKELKVFFDKSALAEREMRDNQFDQMGDPLSRVMVGSQGTDYSNQTGKDTGMA
jgi:hypothetical protein